MESTPSSISLSLCAVSDFYEKNEMDENDEEDKIDKKQLDINCYKIERLQVWLHNLIPIGVVVPTKRNETMLEIRNERRHERDMDEVLCARCFTRVQRWRQETEALQQNRMHEAWWTTVTESLRRNRRIDTLQQNRMHGRGWTTIAQTRRHNAEMETLLQSPFYNSSSQNMNDVD